MAETPRLGLKEDRQSSGKIISVSEHMMNGVISKPDNLIVDLGSFSNGGLYHHISADSRIIALILRQNKTKQNKDVFLFFHLMVNADSQQLPRSFSRKGYLRSAADSASLLLAPPTPSSPGGRTGPGSMQDKPTATSHPPVVVIAMGPTEDSDDPNHHHSHHHHQITVKTGSVVPAASSTSPESQLGRRRSSLPWYNHPKRVLLFFATIILFGNDKGLLWNGASPHTMPLT
ncbi:hypothetical protein V2J09_020993 [Rumex salicifolius]